MQLEFRKKRSTCTLLVLLWPWTSNYAASFLSNRVYNGCMSQKVSQSVQIDGYPTAENQKLNIYLWSLFYLDWIMFKVCTTQQLIL